MEGFFPAECGETVVCPGANTPAELTQDHQLLIIIGAVIGTILFISLAISAALACPKKKVKVKQLIQSGNGQMLETITSTGRLMGESLMSENRQSIAAYNRDSIAAYRDSVASFNGDMVPRASAEYRSYHWGHNTAHIFHTQEHEEIIKE
jgi:hypothetical protein